MRRSGFILIFAAMILLASTRREEEPQVRVTLPTAPMKRAAKIFRVVADELDGAADAADFEEHLIDRCEIVFDEHARDFDFPGPDAVTRPVARRAIRPIVKSLVRYATEKHFNAEQDFRHEP